MGKLKILFFSLLLIPVLGAHAQGYVEFRVVSDKQAAKIVGINTTAAAGVEYIYLEREDSISKRAQRAMAAAATITLCKEMYHQALKQTKYFAQETRIYASIVQEAQLIVAMIPKATKVMSSSGLFGPLNALKETVKITNEVKSLVDLFVKVVNDSEIKNPITAMSSITNDKGGKIGGQIIGAQIERPGSQRPQGRKLEYGYYGEKTNLLDAKDRMLLANEIRNKLSHIRSRLSSIIYICSYMNNFDNFLMTYDIDTWYHIRKMDWACNNVIKSWENIEKRFQ